MKSVLYKVIIALVCVISVCALPGCGVDAAKASAEGELAYFYDESTGKVYIDLNDDFDFKVETWKYYYDEEARQDSILFSVLIKNKTDEVKKDFVCVISYDGRAKKLIASGITTYDIYEPHDLPKKESGAGYISEMLVSADEFLNEAGADKEELLEYIRNVTLEMKWNGGQENVLLVCDKLEYEK
jgi:hypothetical protein